jgi:AcrR family transcriptional regulator
VELMTKSAMRKASNVAGRNTQLLLIDTAERLFAQYGIDAVSLRDIGTEAGQRNTAVINYHFGTREGLIRAIFDERIPTIRQRRQTLFEHVMVTTRAGSTARLKGVLWSHVVPLAEQCGSNHFVAFIARLQTDFGNAEHLLTRAAIEESEWFRNALRMELPHLREPHFEIRMTSVVILTLHVLAARQILEDSPRPFAADVSFEDWVEELVSMNLALIKNASSGGKASIRSEMRSVRSKGDGSPDKVVSLRPTRATRGSDALSPRR